MIDLRVFKARSYAVGVFLRPLVGFVLYGSMVILPIMCRRSSGTRQSKRALPWHRAAIGAFFMMPYGLMTGRFDARKLLAVGCWSAAAPCFGCQD